jgi:prepilin-type processing-associated H-X9-DG protein
VGPEQIGKSFQCTHCGKFAIAEFAPRKRNGMAIASLVCGLLGCIPIASVLAVIFGIIGIRKSKNPHVGQKGWAIAGIVLGFLGVLIDVPVVYVWVMMNHTADRVRSASNVRQVGQAILEYSNANWGHYPPDLGTLVKTQGISITEFLCPSMPGGSSSPSNFDQMTIDEKANWINQHADVVYLGAGLRQGAPPQTIVLYERHDERNSPPDGSYEDYEVQMLFADGHVEPIPSAEAHRRLKNQGLK